MEGPTTTPADNITPQPPPTSPSPPAKDISLKVSSTPITKRSKSRPSPYSKPTPILLSAGRRSRKRKSLTWQPDEKIHKVHYFEYIADERINVTRINNENDANASANLSAGSSPNANNKSSSSGIGKISNASVDPGRRSIDKSESDKVVEYSPWRPLIPIDFSPELPSPGWLSVERSAQAERETYVLGAIDLPGQPSILDEPDTQHNKSEGASVGKESNIKIIPLDNTEGMYTEYQDIYSGGIINGVRTSTDEGQQQVSSVQNSMPFCNQSNSILPNQFQQQLVHATHNSFNFQDMGAQAFQQQAQMPLQFPFQQQPPQPQSQQHQFQTQLQSFPFGGQQQTPQQAQVQQQSAPFVDQPSTVSGPIMPWLTYPFNQVNENSHAHLFRRPAT